MGEVAVQTEGVYARGDSRKKHPATPFRRALMAGFVGFSCYLGWLWVLLFGFVYYQADFYTPTTIQVCRIVMIFALSLGMFLAGVARNFVRKPAGVTTLFAFALIVCIGVPVLTPILAQKPCLVYVCWALMGLGYGALQLLWSRFTVTIGHSKHVSFYVSMMFLAGAVIFVLLSLLSMANNTVALIAGTVISIVSTITGFYATQHAKSRWHEKRASVTKGNPIREGKMGDFGQNTLDLVANDTTGKLQRKRVAKTVFFAFVYSIGYGFAGYCCTDVTEFTYNLAAVGFALLAAGLIAFIVTLKGKDAIFRRPVHYFLPLTAVGIFPMLVLNAQGRFICAIYLLFIFTLYGCINTSLQSWASARQGIDPLVQSSFGRLGNSLGLGVGWLACLLAFSSVWADTAVTTVLVVVLFIFVFTKAFLFPDADLPCPASDSVAASSPSMQEVGIQATQVAAVDSHPGDHGTAGYFRARCEKLAEEYELSPRQLEVLVLLGKGRNAAGIEKALVISNHTAKAHIYNIYKKMDVHSQQQLISMIEAVELDSDKPQ